jgi:ABC-type glycerol-3-phosphate transport system permease component
MPMIIMIAYYVITAFLLALAAWNFVREKERRRDLLLYLLVMVPLVLRLLRWK